MRPIRRLLVANRGEIARRIVRTCRDMGISPVAVHADPDEAAPHVAEADLAVRLPGAAPAETYLRADLLVDAARRTGSDAVHPGYGFLAESAPFAAAVVDAGLTWVGPPPDAIAAMGSTVDAKVRLAAAGVPVLPTWTPDEVPAGAYPVLVKASHGGGGRGMRVVRDPADLDSAVAAARREAESAFGDGSVFVEPWVEAPRHVEVQVLADAHGTVVALGERECSIQRRHQKIVEEAPSPAVSAALRARLAAASVAAAREIGYVGAGTVEFLLAPDGRIAFLEVNTRLQVEHPVTECVTGLDLVRLQIEVAEGAPLPFDGPPPTRGHAIEVRLYAEDPARGWRPSTGTLHRIAVPGVAAEFAVPAGYGLRLDSGVVDGSVVSGHYDPMLAKLVTWAPTRAEAARALAAALARAEVHGLTTNRDLLVRVLRHPAFLAGETDTGFLDRYTSRPSGLCAADTNVGPSPELALSGRRPDIDGSSARPGAADVGILTPLVGGEELRRSALAAALAGAERRRAATPVLGTLPAGWRNVRSQPALSTYDSPLGTVTVDYRPPPEDIRAVATPDRVLLEVNGIRRAYRVHEVGTVSYVDGPDGGVALTAVDPLPPPTVALPAGSLVAPVPGTVVRVDVDAGDRVEAGQPLLALEAMKMEHAVLAPAAGTVAELRVAAGARVDAGALLAVLEADETDEPEA